MQSRMECLPMLWQLAIPVGMIRIGRFRRLMQETRAKSSFCETATKLGHPGIDEGVG